MFTFNARDGRHKRPFGAVPSGTTVEYFVEGPADAAGPFLCVCDDAAQTTAVAPMERCAGGWRAAHTFASPGLYFYAFRSGDRFLLRGEGGQAAEKTDGDWFQQTVYDAADAAPRGWTGGVFYQIFPDRFAVGAGGPLPTPYADRRLHADVHDAPDYLPGADGKIRNDDYFGGNFAGIEEKLPYLCALGVTAIYLNPVCEAHSNHRYNTADYKKPDPLLGSAADFRRLCAAAKRRGIRILLDGVFSHTGDDSVYFNRYGRYASVGAYQSERSPWASWYKFRAFPDDYVSWWGFDTLPEVNEDDPSFTAFICGEGGVVDYWMGLGAAGFRLDVADELPDDFIARLRAAVRRNDPDGLLLGEVWEDASNKVSYGARRRFLRGGELDSVMNYPFRAAILDFLGAPDAALFRERIETVVENYPKPVTDRLMNLLSTHDTERAVNVLAAGPCDGHDRAWQAARTLSRDEYLRGVELLKLAFALEFTLPGVPCVYYGDEIGMTGWKDPFNRAFMRWDAADDNVLGYVRALASRRRGCTAFADGALRFADAPADCAAFVRDNGRERALVAVNRGQTAARARDPLTGHALTVPPWRAAIETF
ncbi:MAG: glycoside hydrolase family 13 protein [Oscillospiraceae bacterium]|nr:glycoside hydrolase family 13 protein [Oscillospiraceae bacterium]